MRTDDRSLPSEFPIVAWSYWQLNMAAGSAIRFHIASLGGWMEISFLGKLGGYDDHPLLLNWLLCYRPMALFFDFRRLVLLIGGCIASTAWFVSPLGCTAGEWWCWSVRPKFPRCRIG